MFSISEAGYDFRGGRDSNLPGGSTISGTGRADIRLFLDVDGDIHVTGKSDGMIRGLTAGPIPVIEDPPEDRVVGHGDLVSLFVEASGPGELEYQGFKGPEAIHEAPRRFLQLQVTRGDPALIKE